AVLMAAAACNGSPPLHEGDLSSTDDGVLAELTTRATPVPVPRLPGTPSPRQVKEERLHAGDEFARFKIRHHAKAFHYTQLPTEAALSEQILFQLYRTEHLEKAQKAREAERKVRVRPVPGR